MTSSFATATAATTTTTTTTTSPPRTIVGSVGSRIRIVLGTTGRDYVVVFNHDDGNRQWQTHLTSNSTITSTSTNTSTNTNTSTSTSQDGSIPQGLQQQLENCAHKQQLVTALDFNTQGAWYVQAVRGDDDDDDKGHCPYTSWWSSNTISGDEVIQKYTRNNSNNQALVHLGTTITSEEAIVVTTAGGFCAGKNLPLQDLQDRIKQWRRQRNRFSAPFFRLFDDGQYFIRDAKGTDWQIHSQALHDRLTKKAPKEICDLGLAADQSWIIIGKNTFKASCGVATQLKMALREFYTTQKAHSVARANAIRLFFQQQKMQLAALERAQRARDEQEALSRQVQQLLQQLRTDQVVAQHQREEKERQRQILEAADGEKEAELLREIDCLQELQEHLDSRKQALWHEAASLSSQARRARVEAYGRSSNVQITGHQSNHHCAVCVVCHESKAQIAMVPCGHVCLCTTCVPQMLQHDKSSDYSGTLKCPICRAVVQSTLKIYLQ